MEAQKQAKDSENKENLTESGSCVYCATNTVGFVPGLLLFPNIVDSHQSKMFWLHNKFPIDLASLVKMPEYQPRPHKKNSASIQPSWVTLDFVRSSGLLGIYIYT